VPTALACGERSTAQGLPLNTYRQIADQPERLMSSVVYDTDQRTVLSVADAAGHKTHQTVFKLCAMALAVTHPAGHTRP
jgi:hypothetical protein